MSHKTINKELRSIQILSLCFVVGLLFPLFCRLTHIIPPESLHNVPKTGRLKRPTLIGIFTGKFQKHFEAWYLHNNGLWEYLVKAQNTLNYHLFNIVSSRYGGETFLGADKALHDRIYLVDMNGLAYGKDLHISNFDASVQAVKLRKIQDYFRSKGKTFLVVIHPTKPLVHPEWVSANQRLAVPHPRFYPMLEESLHAAGVNILHMSIPNNEKDFPIFSKSGAHMTSYGKCLSSKMIIDAIIKERGEVMSRIDCLLDNTLVPPYGEDLDLLKLLNAWGTEASTSLVPGFTLVKSQPTQRSQSRLLAIGTSYLFGILKTFEDSHSFIGTNLIFYKNSKYVGVGLGTSKERKGAKKYSPHDHDVSFALQHDVILLEATEARAGQLGFGFVDDILEQISKGIDRMDIPDVPKKSKKKRKK